VWRARRQLRYATVGWAQAEGALEQQQAAWPLRGGLGAHQNLVVHEGAPSASPRTVRTSGRKYLTESEVRRGRCGAGWGARQSAPYSCTYMAYRHTSTPSMRWKSRIT